MDNLLNSLTDEILTGVNKTRKKKTEKEIKKKDEKNDEESLKPGDILNYLSNKNEKLPLLPKEIAVDDLPINKIEKEKYENTIDIHFTDKMKCVFGYKHSEHYPNFMQVVQEKDKGTFGLENLGPIKILAGCLNTIAEMVSFIVKIDSIDYLFIPNGIYKEAANRKYLYDLYCDSGKIFTLSNYIAHKDDNIRVVFKKTIYFSVKLEHVYIPKTFNNCIIFYICVVFPVYVAYGCVKEYDKMDREYRNFPEYIFKYYNVENLADLRNIPGTVDQIKTLINSNFQMIDDFIEKIKVEMPKNPHIHPNSSTTANYRNYEHAKIRAMEVKAICKFILQLIDY